MKKSFVLLCAGLLACLGATAQEKTETKLPEPWSGLIEMKPMGRTIVSIQAEYRPTHLEISDFATAYTETRRLHTGALGVILDTPLSKSFPIYFDYGIKAVYAGNKYGIDDPSRQFNYFDLSVPVGLLFHANLTNTKISFAGFIGLDCNFYLLGTETLKESGKIYTTNLLDSSYGGNWFNLDWHIGARIYYDRYFFGIGYQGNVTPILKSTLSTQSMKGLTIALGVSL